MDSSVQGYDSISLTSGWSVLRWSGGNRCSSTHLAWTLVVPLKQHELEQFRNRLNEVGVAGKSGLCQGAIDVRINGLVQAQGTELLIPTEVVGCMGRVHQDILNVILERSKHRPLGLGRALLLPRTSLSKGEVIDALDGHQLILPKGATIEEDGVITLPLSDIHYLLALENLESEEDILNFLRLGKHGPQAYS